MFDKFKKKIQGLINIYHFIAGWCFVLINGIPARKLTVIGVTGTDGKTTTCHLIYETLKAVGYKVALVSTVAAYVGKEEIDTGFHITNPDARILQRLLKKIVDLGFTHLVLEVTSHGLDQYRVVGCNFKIGVITNITHEHLDYHGNFAKYREAKAKLVLSTQCSVLNKDDPSFEYLKARSGGKVVPFAKTKIRTINPRLAGEYNRYNVGAAEAVAQIFNVQSSVFNKVIQNFAGVPGRLEEVKLGQPFRAIVDFAHTPNALEQVLRELKRQKAKGKSLILVFGCTGLRDPSKRPIMGETARRLADVAIVTADDPRTEDLGDIYGQIVSGITPLNPPLNLRGGNPKGGGEIVRQDDRRKAINMAIKLAKPGDIVLVAGMGHEKSILIGTIEHPWSDREACEKAIKKYAL